MKRILLLLTVVALMMVMFVAMAAPAFAGPGGNPQVAVGQAPLHRNDNADNQGTAKAFNHTPNNQPCSVYC